MLSSQCCCCMISSDSSEGEVPPLAPPSSVCEPAFPQKSRQYLSWPQPVHVRLDRTIQISVNHVKHNSLFLAVQIPSRNHSTLSSAHCTLKRDEQDIKSNASTSLSQEGTTCMQLLFKLSPLFKYYHYILTMECLHLLHSVE